MLDFIVSTYLNPNLSGVAKFNYLLAQKLQIPCIGLEKSLQVQQGSFLLSLKVRDMTPLELVLLQDFLIHATSKNLPFDLFLHSFDSLETEHYLLENCRQVFCGNAEIQHALQGFDKPLIEAWCPFLVDIKGMITESQLNLFSFGMAHKIQIRYYKLLAELLEKHNVNYSLWVSTAFHEKASFGDFDTISTQLSKIFNSQIQFMGFLSDEAINYFLKKSNLFVAFFEKGVRANNTSVCAAMASGCAVMTNLDEYSPKWMHHGKNILDIYQTQPENFDLDYLNNLGRQAKQDVDNYTSWDKLLELLTVEL